MNEDPNYKEDPYSNFIYPHYRETFSGLVGYDCLIFEVEDESGSCYISHSPLTNYISQKFGYLAEDQSQKSYVAVWTIWDDRLSLMFVNGNINGSRLFTDDIVDNFPDDSLFCDIPFSGTLSLSIQQEFFSPVFNKYLNDSGMIELSFKESVLQY